MSTLDTSDVHRSSLLLKGIGIVTFGLIALCYPGPTLHTLLFPFGILVAINGAVVIFNNTQYASGGYRRKRTLYRKGVIELLIGLVAIGSAVGGVAIAWELIAGWVILTGSAQANHFYKLRDYMPTWPVMMVTGLLSVLFGLFIAINSMAEMVSFTYEIALFALLFGSSMFYGYAKLGTMSQYLGHRPTKTYSLKTATAY